MNNQKVGNLLNLAMEATEREREESLELEVGYDAEDERWNVIIKYSGELSGLESEGIIITPLLGNYAVVNLPQTDWRNFLIDHRWNMWKSPKVCFFLW